MVPSKEQFDSLYEKLDPLTNEEEFSLDEKLDRKLEVLWELDRPTRAQLVEYFESCAAAGAARMEEMKSTEVGRWLFEQQNFQRAEGRLFVRRSDQEVAEHYADYILEKEKKWMNRLYSSACRIYKDEVVWGWYHAVVGALREYHYGQAHLLGVTMRPQVASYLHHAKQLVRLGKALAAAAGDGFLFPGFPGGARMIERWERHIGALVAAHASGDLYVIKRNNPTAKNRIFIVNMAKAHEILFSRAHAPVIADLFYLEGMEPAPSIRSIERIAQGVRRRHKAYGI